MQAEIVRLALHQVDIKLMDGDQMHVLSWRRNMMWDEVLLNGARKAHSGGFTREKLYGLEYGRGEDGQDGERLMLIIDPKSGSYNWSDGSQTIRGVRLENADGPLVAYGSLDPRNYEKPATFSDWMKKTMGMEW